MRAWELLILFALLLAGGASTLNNPLSGHYYSPPPHCEPQMIPVRDKLGKWICITLRQ